MKFERPELSEEEIDKLNRFAKMLVNMQGRPRIMATIIAISKENMLLTKECNLHREARGFDLIPIYEPKI